MVDRLSLWERVCSSAVSTWSFTTNQTPVSSVETVERDAFESWCEFED